MQNVQISSQYQREQEAADKWRRPNDVIKILNNELRIIAPKLYWAAINFDYLKKISEDQ